MRYSVNKESGERELDEVIKPGYILGTKQRVMLDIINKAKNYELPIVIISLNGISFVKERQASKNRDITVSSTTLETSYKRPTPISIKVELTIMTKYMTDLYQIYGKLATQFQPAVPYSWFVPQTVDGNWVELRNKIEWDGELNLDIRTESKNSDEDKFTGKMSFTIDGWIFPTMNHCTEGIIYNIGTTIVPCEEVMSRIYDEITTFRPLVYSVLKGKEWNKYNNPRQYGSAHPMISSVYYSQTVNGKEAYSIMDKARADIFKIYPNGKLTINGYNLKEAKVLLIPTNKHVSIDDGEYYYKKFTTQLHPFPDTIEEKPDNIAGYLLNIRKQTDNQLTIDFNVALQYANEYDIAVVNEIDYDLLSKRKGFTLKS